MKISKFLSFAFICVFFLAGGCATKPKTSSSADSMGDGASSSEGLNFELNGDSDSGKAGSLRTVYFDFNSSQLSSESRGILASNAEILKNAPAVTIQIEGHADERGGVQYNLALGERRANTVKNYLVSMGISSGRLSTVSYGKERPVAFGHDEEAWSQNRRANFVVTGK